MSETKKRIGVLGIGGVGGFFGGLLAKAYVDSAAVDVVFIARGATKAKLLAHGLSLTNVDKHYRIFLDSVTDHTITIGELDALLVCVKTYSLTEAVTPYIDNLKPGGLLITLQNSVNQEALLAPVLPDHITHLTGCAYIISNVQEPGVIVRQKGPEKLHFGHPDGNNEPYRWMEELLVHAGIDAGMPNAITATIWNKFLFISPIAAITSATGLTIGAMLENEHHRDTLVHLVEEAQNLALKKGIQIKDNMPERVVKIAEGLPYSSKSSMQLDVELGKRSEVGGLVAYVIEESARHQLETPSYSSVLDEIKKKTS